MSHDPRMESRSAEDDKLAIFRGWVEMTFCVLTHYELVRAVRNWVDRGSVYYSRVWSRKELQQQAIEHPHLAPVVFVDDIGRGHDDQKGWNLTLLDEWFDWRWKQGLPTIITTNKSIEELNSWDGWERIIDRLADDSWVQTIIMNEESRRRT